MIATFAVLLWDIMLFRLVLQFLLQQLFFGKILILKWRSLDFLFNNHHLSVILFFILKCSLSIKPKNRILLNKFSEHHILFILFLLRHLFIFLSAIRICRIVCLEIWSDSTLSNCSSILDFAPINSSVCWCLIRGDI